MGHCVAETAGATFGRCRQYCDWEAAYAAAFYGADPGSEVLPCPAGANCFTEAFLDEVTGVRSGDLSLCYDTDATDPIGGMTTCSLVNGHTLSNPAQTCLDAGTAFGPRRGPILSLLLLLSFTLGVESAWAQPISVGHLDSVRYPIRVHYPSNGYASLAATVLTEAEQVWEVEVLQMGFDPPMTEDASGTAVPGLAVWIEAGVDDAYAVPVAGIPGTSFTDCTSYLILPPDPTEDDRSILLARETLHAIEMAMDCIESDFAIESSATAGTVLQYPSDRLWLSTYLPSFQSSPHLSLACTFPGDPALGTFHYGAALFHLFLDEWLGDGDGRLLPRLWRAARQTGWVDVSEGEVISSAYNNPDLLHAIASVLEEEGTSFEEAYAEFAVWRYCLGANADNAHFRQGALWIGGEVTVDATHLSSELPLVNVEPSTLPESFGTTYLELDVRGIESPMGVVFSLNGDSFYMDPLDDPFWHVDALRVTEGGSVTVENVPVDDNEQGESWHRDLGDVARLVWAVSVVSEYPSLAYGPPGGGHPFTYSLRIEDLEAAPRVDYVAPSELLQGSSQLLTVMGAGFLQGIDANVEGDGVAVQGVAILLDDTRLWVRVSVTEDAAPGPKTLILLNPNGRWTRADNSFSVLGKQPPKPPTAVGCHCQGSGAEACTWSWSKGLFLALVVLLGALLLGRGHRGHAFE